jgi:hypothetical protein
MRGNGTHEVLMLLFNFVLSHSLRGFSTKMQCDIQFHQFHLRIEPTAGRERSQAINY